MGLTEEEKTTLVSYRLNKAQEVLTEAKDVLNLSHWNLAVNRLYYAVFHACSALLLFHGQSARTHSGVLHLMMLEFVKTEILSKDEGVLMTTLFNMRNTGDYDDLFDWTEQQVAPLLNPTISLIDKIRGMIEKNS